MAKEDHSKDHQYWDNWKNNMQKFKNLEAADVHNHPHVHRRSEVATAIGTAASASAGGDSRMFKWCNRRPASPHSTYIPWRYQCQRVTRPQSSIFQRTWTRPLAVNPRQISNAGRGHQEYTFRHTIIQKVQKENPTHRHSSRPQQQLQPLGRPSGHKVFAFTSWGNKGGEDWVGAR